MSRPCRMSRASRQRCGTSSIAPSPNPSASPRQPRKTCSHPCGLASLRHTPVRDRGCSAGKKITRVPGSHATCGIAGFRGASLPVYDLQACSAIRARQTPRWLVIAAAAPVALAFEAFEGHLRVSPDAIVPQQSRARGA